VRAGTLFEVESVRKLRRDKAFELVEEKHWKVHAVECLKQALHSCTIGRLIPWRNTWSFSRRIAKGRKLTIKILWRIFVKSRQSLDLPKKQGD
jgi:hypothetical protein